MISTCDVGTLQPFVSHHAGEPASPHKVISYDRPLYVLRILRAALDLRRLRAKRALKIRWIVQSAEGSAKARIYARSSERGGQFRHGGQADVQDAGVGGHASLRAFLRRRYFQTDGSVQRNLDRVVVGRVGQRAKANVLQAALPSAGRQPLPQRVAAPQQNVVDHSQRVGTAAQSASHRWTVRQRQGVRLGGAERWRSRQADARSSTTSCAGSWQPGRGHRRAHLRHQLGRAEADVALSPRVVPLERLLRGERAGPDQVHDVALLELQIAAGIDDHVGEAVTLLGDVVVVGHRQVQRLHPGAHQVCDLCPLDLLGVVVSCFVAEAHRVLFREREKKKNTSGF